MKKNRTEDRVLIARHLGKKVREYRIKAGLTQEQLAQIMGVDRRVINGIEGSRPKWSLVTVVQVAFVLRCSVADLFEGLDFAHLSFAASADLKSAS